jgi:hypothetical protein
MYSLLIDRYQKEWGASISSFTLTSFNEEYPTNPLLLDVPSSYFDADLKIMIFGQETNDWEGLFPHSIGMNYLLENYRDFYSSDYCYSYGGQFWNGVSKFKNMLIEKLKPSGKTISVVWNNLIKIGKARVGKEEAKGQPNEAILKWEDNWFDVVLFEMRKLKPDVVIFFSGPDYDEYIKRIFRDASFENLNERNTRQLARVKSAWLPIDSIRTYHPHYLSFNGIDDYLGEIVRAINC